MRRPAILVLVVLAAAGAVLVAARASRDEPPCGAGFTRAGTRCLVTDACPAPLVAIDHGCDARDHDVVEVPATAVIVGPADWEAEGRIRPRTVRVGAFAIDRVEVTVGRLAAFRGTKSNDPARAAHGVAFEEARRFCAARGGRLPTEDEWLAAAGGERPRRYPWGDTGAVCRRAAWGLEVGPCAEGASGPDTVGAHPEGMTPLGIHDLAGNVAEWVDAPCPEPGGRCPRVVRGGSWKTQLATELRTWLRRDVATEVAERGGDPTIGFRCAYDRAHDGGH